MMIERKSGGNMHLQPYELKQKQALPLEAKIIMSRKRIRDWYEHWQGMVYASVSGGLDSTVMYHLIHTQYPDCLLYTSPSPRD